MCVLKFRRAKKTRKFTFYYTTRKSFQGANSNLKIFKLNMFLDQCEKIRTYYLEYTRIRALKYLRYMSV